MRFYLVTLLLCVPALSKLSPQHVIDKICQRLMLTLDYISQKYEQINVDCLFGVVIAGAILEDTEQHAGPYSEEIKALQDKTREIFRKTAPLMRKQDHWNYFAKYVVEPILWTKPIKYKLSEFRSAYALKRPVEHLFSLETYENYSEGFSDHCLSSVINNTLALKPKTLCRLPPKCETFVESLEKGSGYILTHRLLLLQLARARKCKMHPKILSTAMKKICTAIYTEMISVEFFMGVEEIFDLFLEQSLLCAYEGYADFLKKAWLEKVFELQHESGCFDLGFSRKGKRETNVFQDGCADHTTGLGAAVFSIYLNYVVKNAGTVVLTNDWF